MPGERWPDERAFRAFAARNHDVFHKDEWRSFDLTNGRLRTHQGTGAVVLKAPRVYVFNGRTETFEVKAMIGCKRAWPRGALYGASAASIHGLMAPTEPIHIASTRRIYPMEGYRFHRVALPDEHITEVNGLPLTDCPRTLLDACGELYHRQAGRLIDRALRHGLCTLEELADRCEEEARSGRRGINAMRRLLDQRNGSAARSRSDLEIDFFDFLDEFGFATPEVNYLIDSGGGFPWEVDLYWPDVRKGIEVGTAATHGMDVEAFYKDQEKLLQLRALGHEIIVVSDRMLLDKPKLAEQLRKAGIPRKEPPG